MTYLHCMILSHVNYCFSNWSFTGATILSPIKQLYNRSLKVLDKKPQSYHHCSILKKYNFFSFDNFKLFKDVCVIYKVLHGLYPPPLEEFISRQPVRSIGTRAAIRGDCEVQFRRTTFAQNVLSVKGCLEWNKLPINIRECPTYGTFKSKLSEWILDKQTCEHF